MRRGTREYARASLAMIALGLAIFNSLYSTQALLPTLSQQLEVSPSVAALSVSAATGVLALCVVPFSILSEKYGRGRILIISALAATLVGLALPLAQSAPQLTALRAVQGAMIAGAPAEAMTWLAEEVDDADVPATMGLYVAGTSIGGLSGRLIPSLMLESASWRVVLAAASTIALALAIAVALLLPQQRNFHPKDSIRPSAEIRAMARHLKTRALSRSTSLRSSAWACSCPCTTSSATAPLTTSACRRRWLAWCS